MFLIIDNYDSFTYNLYQYIAELEDDVKVVRNDEISVSEIEKMDLDGIIISPGPKSPVDAGICVDVIKRYYKTIPILGVCLGHQCLGAAFDGKVEHAKALFHGKTSKITVKDDELFKDIPREFVVARYHSLIVDKKTLPEKLEVLSEYEDEIMAMRVKGYPVYGLQFHPESILTQEGMKIIENFIKIAKDRKISLKKYVEKISKNEDLSEREMLRIMNCIMRAQVDELELAGFLAALKTKGETTREIATSAKVLRNFALSCDTKVDNLLDIVGTGGDSANTFNISTCAAIIAAACGAKVAKHGNRSVSSHCGSADILEYLGINIVNSPIQVKKGLEEVGMSFIFANNYHSAMKNVSNVRAKLGYRTIFNVLGPLINPVNASYQLAGVYDKSLIIVYAKVLKELGLKKALVVHGSDGLDEITITGDTYIAELNNGEITEYIINPKDFGLAIAEQTTIKSSSIKENASIIKDIFNGKKGPQRDIVVLNAGAALYAANMVDSIKQGVELSSEAIDSKAALKKLNELINFKL